MAPPSEDVTVQCGIDVDDDAFYSSQPQQLKEVPTLPCYCRSSSSTAMNPLLHVMPSPIKKGELHLGLQLSSGESHAKEEPTRDMKQKGVVQHASPWLHPSPVVIGSRGSRDFSVAKPVGMGMASQSITTGAGHKLEAVSNDPLQLKIAPRVVRPRIDLNLPPPPESQVTNTYYNRSDVETAKPFERLIMPERAARRDLGFVPYILESSEVAREYAQMQAAEAAAAAINSRRQRIINHAVPAAVVGDAGPANRTRHHHIYPAKTMAKINEKIEQLKKEALGSPGERRSFEVIQAEIAELEAKKDHIHAKVSGLLDEQGSSSGGRAPPPFFGN